MTPANITNHDVKNSIALSPQRAATGSGTLASTAKRQALSRRHHGHGNLGVSGGAGKDVRKRGKQVIFAVGLFGARIRLGLDTTIDRRIYTQRAASQKR